MRGRTPFLAQPGSASSWCKRARERRPGDVCLRGIDVHRKRSQVAVIDQDGQVLANRNVPNGVEPILGVIGGLPPGTPAALEAAFGWGWLVELLEDYGFAPRMAHPLQCKAIASARLKNDKVDAGLGAAAARGSAARAWIAPPAVRQLRALLRHRAQLVRLRTLLRNRIHAVLCCRRSRSWRTGGLKLQK
jgi:transposase